MERSEENTLADLLSHDPVRIQSAMADLKQRVKKGREIKMAPFGIEIFDPFDGRVPEETQLHFLTVIRRYRAFDPALSDNEKVAAIIALVLRFAERYVAFEAALIMKIAPHPNEIVTNALREIVRHGLSSPIHVKGAAYLVSRLLDYYNDVRRATLEALSEWPEQKPYAEVVEYILPQLESDEVRFITKTE